ncbi:MAG: lipoate--protein ligase family protein [Planctomycetes bacterium]|nr:lipoate--protein ligase family protein [Planctomycetota bacterium]
MSAIVHVILDEPQTGVWNMAVDEALLEESLRSEVVFLRFYRWSEPTVSFGYFQSDEDLRHHPRLSKLPRVRRLSGGGAILHHHEQTYSCSLPPTHRLAQQPYQLYVEIHASFVAFLAEWGVQVTVRGSTSAPRKEPFLCFLREAGPDLVVRGHKILGSAQRRRRGAVLQHGSFLLRASEYTPNLFGLCELVQNSPDTCTEWGLAAHHLARSLGDTIIMSELPADVRSRAATIARGRISTGSLIAQESNASIVPISTD